MLDENGKAAVMAMGCYGIGISRVVAAAIEQNHDEAGIIWPDAMAPWQVVVCVINPKGDAAVADAAASLLQELRDAGLDAALDDRGLRPGAMFADMELIGIPHRVVVSERGLAAGTYEYRSRRQRSGKPGQGLPAAAPAGLIGKRPGPAPVFFCRGLPRYCSGHNPVKITATASACRHGMTRLHLCCD